MNRPLKLATRAAAVSVAALTLFAPSALSQERTDESWQDTVNSNMRALTKYLETVKEEGAARWAEALEAIRQEYERMEDQNVELKQMVQDRVRAEEHLHLEFEQAQAKMQREIEEARIKAEQMARRAAEMAEHAVDREMLEDELAKARERVGAMAEELADKAKALAERRNERDIYVRVGSEEEARALAEHLRSNGVTEVTTYKNDNARFVVARGDENTMGQAHEFLRNMTFTPRNVNLTIYMLMAYVDKDTMSFPENLEPVVAQLAGLFQYNGYELLETASIRVVEGGRAEVSGALPSEQTEPLFYSLRTTLERGPYSQDAESPVEIEQFSFSLEIPFLSTEIHKNDDRVPVDRIVRTEFRAVGIETSFGIKPGQKVVVGKANLDGSKNTLFTIVTANVDAIDEDEVVVNF